MKIKEEVFEQLEAGFLKLTDYSEWLVNIMPVPKKDVKVRMCVSYRDLNKASPKDDFPLPNIMSLWTIPVGVPILLHGHSRVITIFGWLQKIMRKLYL